MIKPASTDEPIDEKLQEILAVKWGLTKIYMDSPKGNKAWWAIPDDVREHLETAILALISNHVVAELERIGRAMKSAEYIVDQDFIKNRIAELKKENQ